MMKNDEKKCHLRNNKVENVLLYHLLNDQSSSNYFSWEEKTYSTTCAKT